MKRLTVLLGVCVLALVGSTAATSATPLQCPLPSGEGPVEEFDATIVGTPGDDVIRGTEGQDVIVGSAATTASGVSAATT